MSPKDMRFSSATGLALVLATAAGQRPAAGPSGGMRSGPPTLSSGNPFMTPVSPSRFGAGAARPWPGNRWPRSGSRTPPVLLWYGPPFLNGPGFYPPFYPPYIDPAAGIDAANAFQGPLPGLGTPPFNAVQPQLLDFDPATNAINSAGANPEHNARFDTDNNSYEKGRPNETFKFEALGAAPCTSTADEYHPPIIALKTHGAYSASKYWTEGKTFHFVTTQGEHLRVPVALVERIYPGSGQKTNH